MRFSPSVLTTLAAILGIGITQMASAAIVEIRTGSTETDDAALYSVTGVPTSLNQNSGAGLQLFVGETRNAGPRRSVLRFDLSAIPAAATVSDVNLQMTITSVPGLITPVDNNHELHRITNTSIWGEGTGIGSGGGGTAANAGEVTWNSVQHPTAWSAAGGDFDLTPSASTSVGTTTGTIVWSDSTPGDGLVADVQAWIDGSLTNNGWLIRGQEGVPGTARVYASSESASAPLRPTLTVTLSALPVELSVFAAE